MAKTYTDSNGTVHKVKDIKRFGTRKGQSAPVVTTSDTARIDKKRGIDTSNRKNKADADA